MKILKQLALVMLACTLVHCGNAEKKEKDQVKLKSNNSSSASSKEDANVTEVVLLATDQMQFNKSEIRVPAGKPIKFTLRHTGTMDIKVMGHNFVLLTQGTEIPAFANQAASAAENDYIPENTDAVIVHTKLLGGGQSDTIDFDAPEPGTYDFICSFPGHYALMKGKFIVE
ncbi:MAG TPA: azurin [Leeuwenhoekiella sp.]|nr:azurin [Leeuwenhoekiella sp.]